MIFLQLTNNIWNRINAKIIKLDIFKQKGDFKNALRALEDYTAMHEDYMSNLLSRDLLFADQKHQLEMKRLKDTFKIEIELYGVAYVVYLECYCL